MRPPPAGSEGAKSNIAIDFSGIKAEAKSSVGDNRGCRHFPPRLSDSYMPGRMKKEVIQNLDSSLRYNPSHIPPCEMLLTYRPA